MAYNDLWKPDGKIDYSDKNKVKKAKKAKKNADRKKKRKDKRKEKQANKAKMRDGLLFHFRLNKYATNAAICFCIHKKTGWPIPGKDNELGKMMADYWSQVKSGKVPSNPGKKKQLSSEEFYNSKRWKELRYIVLERDNATCNVCSATAKDGVQIHVDHIKPRSKYPELQWDLDNLQCCCSDCNLGKSNYDDRDWRLLM